jgi:hypothetical protein
MWFMGKKVAYLDLDAVAYTGASIAEKKAYQWKKKDGTDESEVFPKAALAKEWYEGEIGFEQINPDEWERETIILRQPLEVAIKGLEFELKKWMDSVRKLWHKDCVFSGYLTCSGRKLKDADGLEDRYQHNRYDCKETWTPKPKPEHLSACRTHFITAHDWVKMSPPGIEADAVVVGLAERRGEDACIGFKDKDLRQAMNVHLVEMNAQPRDRVLEKTSTVGSLILKRNAKGVAKVEGEGFKLLCYQTAAGDSADGYKGLKGFAAIAGFNLFDPLETVEECCKALVDLYNEKFPDGKKYTSWDKKEMNLSAMELLTQHMRLAYHERSSRDIPTPIERYLNGDNPLYQH